MSRRTLIKSTAVASAASLVPGLNAAIFAQGSDKPEKEEVRVGFIPLTDCASVVMASVLGFDKKYGVKIVPTKEASWAGVRDKLVNGELGTAHVLCGLAYGVPADAFRNHSRARPGRGRTGLPDRHARLQRQGRV